MKFILSFLTTIFVLNANATYFIRPGSITSAMLGTLAFSGLTEDTVPDLTADFVPTFDVSAGVNKKVLLQNLVKQTIVSTGTSYTASSANDMILTTGNITVTLPLASIGKPLFIMKTDASMSNIVTLSPNAANNFATAGSTAVSTTLNSFNESVFLIPSGTTWYVRRTIPNSVLADTTNTITGVSANPTKPTGIVRDRMFAVRNGIWGVIDMNFQTSNTTSAATGTGDYLFLIPFTVDTAISIPYTGTSFTVGTLQIASSDECWVQQSTTWGWGFPILYDSTHFRILDKNLNVFVSSSQYPLTVTPTYRCTAKWPISGVKGD